MDPRIRLVEAEYNERRQTFPAFKSGDTINVHVKIKEGSKERIQQFQGIVIRRQNTSTNGETFMVHKVSGGIGVNRTFPLLSPSIHKIEVVQRGVVRRARPYYLLDRKGKAKKVKQRRPGA